MVHIPRHSSSNNNINQALYPLTYRAVLTHVEESFRLDILGGQLIVQLKRSDDYKRHVVCQKPRFLEEGTFS